MPMILAREDAINHWRNIMGPTKSTKYETRGGGHSEKWGEVLKIRLWGSGL